MISDTFINSQEFFSICTKLVFEAGYQIKQAYETTSIISQKKSIEEEYTEIDLKIQKIYTTIFKERWPTLKIIAEEIIEYNTELNVDQSDFMDSVLIHDIQGTQLNIEDVILWIDPLDGTSVFIKGKKSGVVTLLGLSMKGKAKLGVIGKFYDKISDENGVVYEWNPRCYFADAEKENVYEAYV